MLPRPFTLLASALVVALAAGCGGDGDEAAAPPSTPAPSSASAGGDRIWRAGEAVLELDGTRYEFLLDFCALQPVDPDPDTNTVTLQVDGAVQGDAGTTLSVVETYTPDGPARIQVVSVRFEDGDGTLVRAWEAQRVVNPDTGEVDDVHGDGTTPLLEVQEGDELAVAVDGATFWQFDMTGEDDRAAGTGSLEATCRVA